MNPSNDYKLADLDCLIGNHYLQMIRASLLYLGVPEQEAISPFVETQELGKIVGLFETEEAASMDICSLDRPQGRGSLRDLLKVIRPYGSPTEQNMIDMTETLMEDRTPIERLRRFLTPEQQSRPEVMEMIFTIM